MNHISLLVHRLFKPILNYGIDILEHYPLCYFKYNLVVIKIKQKEDVYITSSLCFRYAHHDQYKYRRIRMPVQVVYHDQNRPH